MNGDELIEAWIDALRVVYEQIRRDRLRELNGDRVKAWRTDGLHSTSYLWGLADARCPDWLLDAMSEAPGLLAIDPPALRTAAETDAYDEFVSRVRASASASDGGNRGR